MKHLRKSLKRSAGKTSITGGVIRFETDVFTCVALFSHNPFWKMSQSQNYQNGAQ